MVAMVMTEGAHHSEDQTCHGPLSVMDVVALRAEIKSWERDFKSKHARDPQVQDIKDRPGVGADILTSQSFFN